MDFAFIHTCLPRQIWKKKPFIYFEMFPTHRNRTRCHPYLVLLFKSDSIRFWNFFSDRMLPIITSYSTLYFVRSCSPWNVIIPSVPDVKSRDFHKRLNVLETRQRISSSKAFWVWNLFFFFLACTSNFERVCHCNLTMSKRCRP